MFTWPGSGPIYCVGCMGWTLHHAHCTSDSLCCIQCQVQHTPLWAVCVPCWPWGWHVLPMVYRTGSAMCTACSMGHVLYEMSYHPALCAGSISSSVAHRQDPVLHAGVGCMQHPQTGTLCCPQHPECTPAPRASTMCTVGSAQARLGTLFYSGGRWGWYRSWSGLQTGSRMLIQPMGLDEFDTLMYRI